MDLFEFILIQQQLYPIECGLIFLIIAQLMVFGSIGLFIITLLHGYPTQRMIYVKHDADQTPSKTVILKGRYKEELEYKEARRRRIDKGFTNIEKFIKKYPYECLIAVFIFVIGVVLSGAF